MTCHPAGPSAAEGRHENVTRVRAQPLAEPKAPLGRKDRRSRRALVLRTRRDSGGAALVTGVCVELAAGQVVAERIVYAGPGPAPEVAAYVATHRARTAPGANRRIRLVSACNLGRLLRDSVYRQGATVVGAGLAAEVAGLAEWWGPSRSRRGGWSFGLAGLGGPTATGRGNCTPMLPRSQRAPWGIRSCSAGVGVVSPSPSRASAVTGRSPAGPVPRRAHRRIRSGRRGRGRPRRGVRHLRP